MIFFYKTPIHRCAPSGNLSLKQQLSFQQADKHLWKFKSECANGLGVSSLSWNQGKTDVLAVGYGSSSFGSTGKGLLSIWSPKNPKQAKQVISTRSGVSTLDFSSLRQNLLAVGFYDGSVSIHNICRPNHQPSISATLLGKHRGPVWQVRWILRTTHEDEYVISVSTDGQIIMWNSRANLLQVDFLKLNSCLLATDRIFDEADLNQPQVKGAGKIICFDFSPNDTSTYIIGTENGLLHRCSCSLDEQFLNSYLGHDAPIYQVQWSPHLNQIFISAAADWTVKLWHEKVFSPVLVFRTDEKYVTDVCWAPTNSTVFACASLNGTLQVWDIERSTLEPKWSKSSSRNIICLSFARNSSNVAAGCDDGTVSTFHISGLEFAGSKSSNRLSDAIAKSVFV